MLEPGPEKIVDFSTLLSFWGTQWLTYVLEESGSIVRENELQREVPVRHGLQRQA